MLRTLLSRPFDALGARLMQPANAQAVDFTQPRGEPALVPPDSVSWRIFRNPVALFTGGVAAVILELADPAVRTGVWEHSNFKSDPVNRLQRTGLAAMVTVYGARSVAERMIAGIVRRHDQVTGMTPAGEPYRANDVALLSWVQATATFGFVEAYHRYVAPLSDVDFSRTFAEGQAAADLFGAHDAPRSRNEWDNLLESKRGTLEFSTIVLEFLHLMRDAPVLPVVLRPAQRLMVRAAVDLVPAWVRERLGLTRSVGLRSPEVSLMRWSGSLVERLLLTSSPSVGACIRLGLPPDWLLAR